MLSPDALCAHIAQAQHGVLNRAQALAAGLSARSIRYRIHTKRWIEVLPGVYRIAGSPESWRQLVEVACLWAGPDAAASHRAAAVLWSLLGPEHQTVDIACERSLDLPVDWLQLHRPKELPAYEITEVDGIPVTTVARTLLDLGAVCRPWTVERALDDALREQMTDLDRLDFVLRRHRAMGRNGCGVLARLLEVRFPGYRPTDSTLEDLFFAILDGSYLPTPVRQHPISDGNKTYRIDLAYPSERLAIEVDSYKHHFGRVAWSNDIGRSNVLVARGWGVLRFTKEDASDPARVISTVDAALNSLRPRPLRVRADR